jgi:thiamine biosynthesis lipoprotein
MTKHRLALPCVVVVLSILLTVRLPAGAASDGRAVFRTQTMGTWATLTIVTSDSASVADLAYDALTVLHRVDSLMSNWTNTSEVARINREAAANEIVVQPEVADVIAFGQQVAQESGGTFDITVEPLVQLWGFIGGTPRVPSQSEITEVLGSVGPDNIHFQPADRVLYFTREGVGIDLGGIAKGYGVDRVANVLRGAGVSDALIDLSGNMVAAGDAGPGRDGWVVGIRDPNGVYPYIARIRLNDEAVATSGDYEQFVAADNKRYGHILDPRTGWSASGLSSVTVVADRAMTADAWATALFVAGPKQARQIAGDHDELTVVLLEPGADGTTTVWVEEALRKRFELEDSAKQHHTVRYF